MNKLLQLFIACALGTAIMTSARADQIIDARGDYTPTYAGPRNGDLDVLRAEVTFTGTEFLFASTSDAPVGTTAGGFFVWGIDRGAGTARFGALASGVLFDSVVVIRPDGNSVVNDLISGTSTPLALTGITISGNDLLARVSLALLPSQGLRPDQYTVNLWPRFQVGSTGNNATDISDFAPNNSNAPVTAVPEPATMLLLGTGLAGVAAKVRGRKRQRNGAQS